MSFKHECKFCNGTGRQSSGLTCISCKGKGFFEVTGKIKECKACEGTGRAHLRTLPCLSCKGRGFLIKATKKAVEKKIRTRKEKIVAKKEAIVERLKKEKAHISRKVKHVKKFGGKLAGKAYARAVSAAEKSKGVKAFGKKILGNLRAGLIGIAARFGVGVRKPKRTKTK